MAPESVGDVLAAVPGGGSARAGASRGGGLRVRQHATDYQPRSCRH